MSIKLRIANQVTFKVDGAIRVGADDVKFDFELLAERLPQTELAKLFDEENNALIVDTLKRVASDWRGVLDEDGRQADYTHERLEGLLEAYPGLGTLAIRAYVVACGVAQGRRKN